MDPSQLSPAEMLEYITRLERENKTLSQLTQRTTLNRFLENCHVYLSIPLQVRPRVGPIPVLSSLTSPKGRECPRRLKKWKDFDRSTRKIFDRISAIYHPQSEPPPTPYPVTIHIEELGDVVQKNQITSEEDLRLH